MKNVHVFMSSFDVGKCKEFNIQHLELLNHHGRLSIGEVQNIENHLDAKATRTKKINFLYE